eukprot:CAMPEP_0202958682 /NCGR_PEP_ID=MMETSP1396-20130829/2961_1 /ASSEMBLY_ACC=CAM_ASM_000872 /TAXON_ID= /ORGANISM="Pseudokeronopsis sp., Strain Brazil" /LENGTH=65 /DNA_ID=CAMNT_0049676861 /DNA_START=486 /DNA_END=683 /DNA_ORIENTATION=+
MKGNKKHRNTLGKQDFGFGRAESKRRRVADKLKGSALEFDGRENYGIEDFEGGDKDQEQPCPVCN